MVTLQVTSDRRPMDRLDTQIERRPPLTPDSPADEIALRFSADPTLNLLAVVQGERPLGLVQRRVFEAGNWPGDTPAAQLMNSAPLLADGAANPTDFRDWSLASCPEDLERGFIVTDQGRYLGVGDSLTLLKARSGRARTARDTTATLTRTLASDVLRQLEGARTFTDALDRLPMSPDARTCAHALTQCLGDIHNLMRRASVLHAAETGHFTLTPKATRLRDILDGLAHRWTARAQQDGVTLLCGYDGAPDLSADLDPERLGELFDCVIERALAESGRGAVEVTLRATSISGGLALEGTVRDCGPVLATASLARIFDPLDSGASLTQGLGMAYAAHLAGAMGGLIHAEANAGTGVTVMFEMIAPESSRIEADPAIRSVPTTAHILIVDDNATNRMVAEALCEMFDCTSEQVADGVEAVEAASVGSFDLILMDIKMPRMDGMAATRAIRALPGAVSQIPIVALTANADPADVRAYLDAGMNDVVEKPIKADRLLTVLDRVLSGVTDLDSQAA
ncbi:MAG: response regulator [Caulobacteraceae bacterium]|nr:response regulator [Caulobacteraceae bacterium]